TKIDYPILQAEDNDYYLNRNYKREDTPAGSIFVDYRNNVAEENRNTIVYGHRMKDDTMFNSLTKYLDEDFLKDHQTIKYDTMYGSYDAEVLLLITRQQNLIIFKRNLLPIKNMVTFYKKYKINLKSKRILMSVKKMK